jgi:hypothetical protein
MYLGVVHSYVQRLRTERVRSDSDEVHVGVSTHVMWELRAQCIFYYFISFYI